MTGRDYNGVGEWSFESVIRRYESNCIGLGVPIQRLLRPKIYGTGDDRRVCPIMEAVTEGIREGDLACIELGIDFICESMSFPFGMRLKSQAAHALKKAPLTPRQLDRIRARLANMLIAAYLPQEYRFYARLFRRTGLGEYKDTLAVLEARGRRMAKYVNYVRLLAAEESHDT